jgi:hypothetical protein
MCIHTHMVIQSLASFYYLIEHVINVRGENTGKNSCILFCIFLMIYYILIIKQKEIIQQKCIYNFLIKA